MMSESTVRIRFTGSRVVRRIVGDYVWDASNDHVTDVDLDTAADLLTSPENDWQLAEKPKQTVHRDLAERMGLAPKELIIVPDDAPETPVGGPVLIQFHEDEAADVTAEGEENNG